MSQRPAPEAPRDPLDQMMDELEALIARTRERMRAEDVPLGSRTLAYAKAAGYPIRASYTVQEMADITGLDKIVLYDERKAGRLRCYLPRGQERGFRIPVEAMDEWMEANTV